MLNFYLNELQQYLHSLDLVIVLHLNDLILCTYIYSFHKQTC